jgi:hypothetical protein
MSTLTHKKQLVQEASRKLIEYGYTVYVAKSGEYGFYTDGKRVVCFGGCWNFALDYSGNYQPQDGTGTGWQIAKELGVLTREQADQFIKANAPHWAVGNRVMTYSTPEQHLATYGKSSGYERVTDNGERTTQSGKYTVGIHRDNYRGWFEHNTRGEDAAGGLWFEDSKLIDFDGMSTLPQDVITGIEALGLIVPTEMR